MLEYNIIKTLAEISEKDGQKKLLTVTQWGKWEAKLDLRTWIDNGSGKLLPSKGLTLTREEAEQLRQGLEIYLQEGNE